MVWKITKAYTPVDRDDNDDNDDDDNDDDGYIGYGCGCIDGYECGWIG